jgi:prolyl oligopeptidase
MTATLNRDPLHCETSFDVSDGPDDPHRWLEDQDSPATREFIIREQRVYREYLDRHSDIANRIEPRVTELLTVETVDLPVSDRRGGQIYLKREAHQEQKSIYRTVNGIEELLVSVEILGCSPFTSLDIIQVSAEGHFLAFGIRTGGEDAQEVGVYDFRAGQLFSDRLPRGLYRGLVFDPGGTGFFYVHEEAEGPYQQRHAVRRHKFGDVAAQDIEVFYAGNGLQMRLVLQGAEDGSALGYHIASLESVPQTRFLVHELPLKEPPRELFKLTGAGFGVRFSSHTLKAITTYGAPNGRLVQISPEHPEPDSWRDLVAETDFQLYRWEPWGDLLVLHYMEGAQKLTRVLAKSGEIVRTIEYPTSGTTMVGQLDTLGRRLFYSHSDVAKTPAIYSADLNTAVHTQWWRQPGPTPKVRVQTERNVYRSKDGVEIPITLIHPVGPAIPRPMILSAYGGGGVSVTAQFSPFIMVLLEEGLTVAIAHVRGGGEGGLAWRQAGWKHRKQTSVDDLIAGAEWLVEQGLTTSDRLGIAGQSAGGLLVLAALTQKPQMCGAVLALGPLADLTRFHLFGVGRGFIAEFGSPESPEEFAALYRLSPYHHVRPGEVYPPVLIISGDRDKRCDGLHARKMIARLRSVKFPRRPILLDYTEMRGHKPVLPLSERIRGLTNRLTFLVAELCGMSAREGNS